MYAFKTYKNKRIRKHETDLGHRCGQRIIDDARGNLKKVSLELGGKSPVIILEDADLEDTIAGAAQGIFSNAGQVCVAGGNLLEADGGNFVD